jgi:hypothetical protein
METWLMDEKVRGTVAAMRMPNEDKEIVLGRTLAGEPEARLAVFWAAQQRGGGDERVAGHLRCHRARRPDGKIGQLLVTRENGQQVSQEWTGVTYRSTTEAYADMKHLNCGRTRS